MPDKKSKKTFHVYEDHDATEPEYCNGGFLCSLCFRDSTAVGPCTACCTGCPNCGTQLDEPLKQEPGLLTEDTAVHLTRLGSTTDSLFQVSSNGESLTTIGSSKSSSTTLATKSPSPPPYICERGPLPHNEYQTSVPTTPIRSRYAVKNKTPASPGRHNQFCLAISQQRRSPHASQRVVPSHQPSRSSKSLSLTGSQDSLIPISPSRTLIGQQRSPKASRHGTRTHAEKLRAALACPVDELPQLKCKSPKKTFLKKKIGLLLRRVQYKFEKPMIASSHQFIKSNDDDLEKLRDF